MKMKMKKKICFHPTLCQCNSLPGFACQRDSNTRCTAPSRYLFQGISVYAKLDRRRRMRRWNDGLKLLAVKEDHGISTN